MFKSFYDTKMSEDGTMLAVFNVYAEGGFSHRDEMTADMVQEELQHLKAREEQAPSSDARRIKDQITQMQKGASALFTKRYGSSPS